jgi:hypothetical protein
MVLVLTILVTVWTLLLASDLVRAWFVVQADHADPACSWSAALLAWLFFPLIPDCCSDHASYRHRV